MNPSLTAVVFTYNRRDIVETALRSVRFADHLVVVDKTSNDGTAEIGKAYADEFVNVEWSPTVEPTRAQIMPQIRSDWVIMIDDDECLNTLCIEYIKSAIEYTSYDIHFIPFRHFILSRHDESAYYWPEYRPALFRNGSISFKEKVHNGLVFNTENLHYVSPDTGASILHLSHENVASWIEKTNRYTSQSDRASGIGAHHPSPTNIRNALEHWLKDVPDDCDPYLSATAALRGVYDIIDLLKLWESNDPEISMGFSKYCLSLNEEYDRFGIVNYACTRKT
jgi:glycosyltransferase involved in cell wall biosynthesis